jgi:broad specificity phosphatase PhoE
MSTLERWIDAACAELGVDRATVDERIILDLARDSAHQVDRPAAPVTAFLAGIAVGSGESLADVANRLTALIRSWQDAGPGQP